MQRIREEVAVGKQRVSSRGWVCHKGKGTREPVSQEVEMAEVAVQLDPLLDHVQGVVGHSVLHLVNNVRKKPFCESVHFS